MKKLIVANWKMQMTARESARVAKIFARRKWPTGVKITIAPSFPALTAVKEILRGSAIALGAQDACFEERGAFTGAVSPMDLREAGVKFVILGHSERRRIFFETDEMIARKVQAAADAGLVPLLCVGETLEERKGGKTWEVISRQVSRALPRIFPKQGLSIAYEPVWAIGTGVPAAPQDASRVHRDIAALLEKRFQKAQAASCHVIYGGSVDGKNAGAFAAQERVDGFLVGGASLKPDSFADIADACL